MTDLANTTVYPGQLHLELALLHIRSIESWDEYYLAVDRWEANPTDENYERMIDLGAAADSAEEMYRMAVEERRQEEKRGQLRTPANRN